ncbi:RraA family protein [Streptomyces sp. CA-135486]|uniref:RraA family protein n=1 Tax=Streptomyces sp. CA-135486 TaxID=3240049 RepID=UPI003D8DC922
MNSDDNTVLARYGALDTTVVSDALDGLNLPSGVGGFRPAWGRPKVVGLAATVGLGPIGSGPAHPGAHIAATAIAAAGPREVLVVANEGRLDVSCWGGLLSLGATVRGVRGVVADGACRDADDARRLGFPVYAKATTPVTARGRLRQVTTGEPVRIAAVTVAPGDIVVADESGIVFVPRDRAEEVLEAAEALAVRENAIAGELCAGAPLPQAMRDARLAGHDHNQGVLL